jgi:hypothetical protein
MPDRLCCPVDAYVFLARGGKLLMLRRAADAAYAPSLVCPDAGHLRLDRCCAGMALVLSGHIYGA